MPSTSQRVEPAAVSEARCRACRGPELPDYRVIPCIRCSGQYHLGCLRPMPEDPSRFTCLQCLDRNHGIQKHTASQAQSMVPNNPATTMLGLSINPFLSPADDSSPLKKCIMPNCQEKTVQNFPACSFHLGPVSPKPTKVADNQPRTDAAQTTGRPPENGSAPSRKLLDSKVTARKSAARSFVISPAKIYGAKTNGRSLSPANRTTTNSSRPSSISSVPAQQELPSRKRQRISSPTHDDASSKFARPLLPKETSGYYGSYLTLNGRERDSWPKTYASFLGRDDEHASTRSSSQDTNNVSVNGAGSGLKAVPSPTAGLVSEPPELNQIDQGLTSGPVTPLEKPQSCPPTPTNSKKREKVARSPYSGLNLVTQTPPLEKQRRRLAETFDSSALDRFIYGQEASSQPPLGGKELPEQEPKKRQDVYYGHIDPRTHWTRPHSDEWYRKKQAEIIARGGRKANFGKAAQRLRQQRLNEDPDAWEEALPDRVRNDEAWLGAMRWFRSQEQEGQSSGVSHTNGNASPVRKKRPYRRRNQVAVPEAEAEPSDGPGRLNSEPSNSDTEAPLTTARTKSAHIATRTKPSTEVESGADMGY